ncbi:Uncharacterized protein SCF082_LOCUS4541 [Durusdinium trenchii]|uniref:Uncharacterized protein n=1 Tax=Durusdinium trenchii TaxID=1381693 RepID=A0ABP0I0T8_9DINO
MRGRPAELQHKQEQGRLGQAPPPPPQQQPQQQQPQREEQRGVEMGREAQVPGDVHLETEQCGQDWRSVGGAPSGSSLGECDSGASHWGSFLNDFNASFLELEGDNPPMLDGGNSGLSESDSDEAFWLHDPEPLRLKAEHSNDGNDLWEIPVPQQQQQQHANHDTAFALEFGDSHNQRKFCGRTIKFRAVCKQGHQDQKLLAYGRFDTAKGTFSDVVPGSRINIGAILEQERKRGRALAPWYPSKAKTATENEIDFEFNSESQGWHYDWVATKYTCDTLHVFKVFLFRETSRKDVLECIGVFNSPSFQIYCRRRQRFRKMDAAVQSTPATLLHYIMVRLHTIRSSPESDTESEMSSQFSPRPDSGSSSGATSTSPAAKPSKVDQVLERLASHIVMEDAFTERINNVVQQISIRRDKGESIDIGYKYFLNNIRDYLQSYLREEGISMSEIQAQHEKEQRAAAQKNTESKQNEPCNAQSPTSPERQVRQVFLDLIDFSSASANRLKRPRRVEANVLEMIQTKKCRPENMPVGNIDVSHYQAFSAHEWTGFDPEGVPCLSGTWVHDNKKHQDVSKLRERINMPYMRIKLLESMECEITLDQDEHSMKANLKRKLLSDGFIEYTFDGVERPFDFKDPLMCVSKPMAVTKVAVKVGNAVLFRHKYTADSRMTRIIWCDPAKHFKRLTGLLYFETLKNGRWEIETELLGVATRKPESD